MIRRVVAAGLWQVIEQREHARISGELATAWGPLGLLADPRWRDELLFAITHHDDGWATWDSDNAAVPIEKRDRSFHEMEPSDALPIWSESIRVCADRGPLAGYAVAGHFLRLAREGSHAAEPLVADWCKEMTSRQQAWLAGSSAPMHQQAEASVSWVRTFDWFSLWLCLYCHRDPVFAGQNATTILDDRNVVGAGANIVITATPSTGPWAQAAVSPWCFSVAPLELQTSANSLTCAQDWAVWRGIAATDRIDWRVLPATTDGGTAKASALPTRPYSFTK